MGKAIPYGVYDVTNNQGWVSVGIDHDTAYFATASIRRWWQKMGTQRFPRAAELFITADGGGSNGHRTRLWKVALQDLADEIGLKMKERGERPSSIEGYKNSEWVLLDYGDFVISGVMSQLDLKDATPCK